MYRAIPIAVARNPARSLSTPARHGAPRGWLSRNHRVGPIAWQTHNDGLFDEFEDVAIELEPKDER